MRVLNGSWGEFHQFLDLNVIWMILQQILRGHKDPTGMRKEVKNQESALTLKSIWEFEVLLQVLRVVEITFFPHQTCFRVIWRYVAESTFLAWRLTLLFCSFRQFFTGTTVQRRPLKSVRICLTTFVRREWITENSEFIPWCRISIATRLFLGDNDPLFVQLLLHSAKVS